jgi:hypothetical protein
MRETATDPTRAVLALFGISPRSRVRAYASPVAVWIEGPRDADLPAPAQWSEKRRAWYVDTRKGLPGASASPTPTKARAVRPRVTPAAPKPRKPAKDPVCTMRGYKLPKEPHELTTWGQTPDGRRVLLRWAREGDGWSLEDRSVTELLVSGRVYVRQPDGSWTLREPAAERVPLARLSEETAELPLAA